MNKSEELAKLLGLPVRYLGQEWHYEDRTYSTRSKICNTFEEAKKFCSEEFEPIELKIDFTSSDNFVKLLNMEVQIFSWKEEKYNLGWILAENWDRCFDGDVTKTVTDRVALILQDFKGCVQLKHKLKYGDIDFLKQGIIEAAQQTEWEY